MSLGVGLSRCVCVRHSVGSEGNALYPVLSSFLVEALYWCLLIDFLVIVINVVIVAVYKYHGSSHGSVV